MKSLSRENQADIIEAFNSTSRYLDDLLDIDIVYFDQMVDRINLTELQFLNGHLLKPVSRRDLFLALSYFFYI